MCFLMEKVHFWPSNSCLGLILAIELQNRISLTIQPLKPFIFDHRAVLLPGFADVDATLRWVHLSATSLLSPSSLFLSSPLSTAGPRAAAAVLHTSGRPRLPCRSPPSCASPRVCTSHPQTETAASRVSPSLPRTGVRGAPLAAACLRSKARQPAAALRLSQLVLLSTAGMRQKQCRCHLIPFFIRAKTEQSLSRW